MTLLKRLTTVGVAASLLVVGLASPVWAHGLGGRSDLPVPLSYFLVGAAVVLVLSFVTLAVLWPTPRWQQPPQVRTIRLPGGGVLRRVFVVVGVVGLGLVVVAGIFGLDNSARNPASVLVWVAFWLVVPFSAAVIGDTYQFVNPWRTLTSGLRLGAEERLGSVRRWGIRPAVAVFVAFTWLELVYPDSASPRTVAVAALIYTIGLVAAIEWAGQQTALTTFDAFTTYNRLIAGIAPIAPTGNGTLGWRGWLRGLPHLPEPPGVAAFVVAMIGTVTFDGLSATPWYDTTFGPAAQTVPGRTLGLLGAVALIGLGYWAACATAARLGGGGKWTAGSVASRFAHTLVPIALAYAFAHYFTLIVFEGQLLISSISDPFGLGWDLFGTRSRTINYTLIGPTAVWYIQVGVIVGGHLAGVVLAHDRALHDFPPARAVRSQYAMLGLMVALTGLGLTILAAG